LKKYNTQNIYICHRDFIHKSNYREGGGDNLRKKIFKESLSLEISHGSFEKKNFFNFSISRQEYCSKKKILKKKFPKQIKILKYPIIFFIFIIFLKKHKIRPKLILGIDPISTFLGVLIKFIFNAKNIFHITDYSDKRFSNIILNLIYKIIFNFSLSNSDFVTSPSQKLISKIRRKIYYIPNLPQIKCDVKTKKRNFILFLYPKIDHGVNIENIINCGILLKNFKRYKVFVTGYFTETIIKKKFFYLIKKNQLNNIIIHKNFIKNKQRLKKILSHSIVGMTSYNITKIHNYYDYADSLKIRQYCEFGIIVLTEGLTPLAKIINNKFGFIYKSSSDMLQNLKLILTNKKLQNNFHKNSKNWSISQEKISNLEKLKKKLHLFVNY
jgi:hypothetical protein